MTKYLLAFIALIILVVVVVLLISPGGLLTKKATATFGSQKVILDVADTEKSREIGLSGRASLAENTGMVFLFDQPSTPTFWMKGMKFPIDIIFLNNKKIVTIYKNVKPPKTTTEIPTSYYTPTSPSDTVIELKAGASDKYKLKTGDSIKLSL